MKPETSVVDALVLLQAFENLDDPYYVPEMERLRTQIPRPILLKHDRRRRRNQRSIASATDGFCGHCDFALPIELMKPMRATGSMGTCPQCGGFLYAGATPGVR
jgi:predicted  nucleic acid-binding Zn-ribbon protein